VNVARILRHAFGAPPDGGEVPLRASVVADAPER